MFTTFRALSRFLSVWILGASLVFFSVQLAGAQTITLSQAYKRMLSSDLEFEILDLEDDVAEELIRQAKGERYPRVNLSVSYVNTRQEIKRSDNTTFSSGISTFPTTTVSFSVVQPIFDLPRWRSMGVAQAESELVKARAEVVRNRMAARMSSAFAGVARAQLRVERAKALVRARSQLESALSSQVDAGREEIDVLFRAQGNTFGAKSDLADAELGKTEALFELYRFTGPGFENVAFRDRGLSSVNMNRLKRTFSRGTAKSMSPEVQAAKAGVIVAEKQQLRQKGNFYPTASLSIDVTSEETDGSLFGGGSDVLTSELGVNVTQSIYEGGVRRSRVREADLRIQIAQARVKQATDLAGQRYTGLMSSMKKAQSQVSAVSRQLRKADQALVATQDREQAGRVGAAQTMEARLRRDTLRTDVKLARLRVVRLQFELYALFGSLDIDAISGQLDS
jgi:outer membrane protein